ncbi:hypothetical protein EW146_g367 [Bondarzewia mesenterica]|uniref:Uncharacterized protein n=1 Tax=Bondarzewia mesenterica TaxID=1095465 RepID=A0A4S4M798_9AGAM|nr:hypothetical protein EW146_g367 [Bondarzewia mesenterica]
MSSTTTASSSVTASSSSPTPTNTGTNGGSTSTTASMLFAFLIVFLALFGLFVFGGVLWHHVVRRRGQAGLDFGEGINIQGMKTPELWEVWTQEEKKVGTGSWDSLRPLSVEVESSSARSFSRSSQGMISPSSAPPQARGWLPSSFRPDPAAKATPPEPVESVQVSFLIAMPSQTRSPGKAARCSIASESSRFEDWSLSGEYVIGTQHAPFREGPST